jgi:hypothetical protein
MNFIDFAKIQLFYKPPSELLKAKISVSILSQSPNIKTDT